MAVAITATNVEKNCEVKAMNEYLKRDEVLDKLDAMIAYWETRDDCWVHTLQVARSAIASIEPVKDEPVDEAVCECWERGHWWLKDHDTCNCTREREPCTCGGDTAKCDFYPNKRGVKNG